MAYLRSQRRLYALMGMGAGAAFGYYIQVFRLDTRVSMILIHTFSRCVRFFATAFADLSLVDFST
jgi:uncharacterized protein YjaZ